MPRVDFVYGFLHRIERLFFAAQLLPMLQGSTTNNCCSIFEGYAASPEAPERRASTDRGERSSILPASSKKSSPPPSCVCQKSGDRRGYVRHLVVLQRAERSNEHRCRTCWIQDVFRALFHSRIYRRVTPASCALRSASIACCFRVAISQLRRSSAFADSNRRRSTMAHPSSRAGPRNPVSDRRFEHGEVDIAKRAELDAVSRHTCLPEVTAVGLRQV